MVIYLTGSDSDVSIRHANLKFSLSSFSFVMSASMKRLLA